MQTTEFKQPNWSKQTDFWEKMAARYPLPFEAKTLARTSRVLELARGRGVDFAGAAVLDIGCGTGIYTLPLVREGATGLTGLDDSAVMLARLSEVADLHGIAGVKTIKASWKDIDIAGLGLAKSFDIALGSMTPALQTERDFLNMEGCARRWCVYVGWGAKRQNALMQEVFEAHGLEFRVPPGFAAANAVLAGLGRKPSLDVWETSWEWNGTLSEALEHLSLQIETHGVRPRRELIERILDAHSSLGRVTHATSIEQGLLVWRVD